MNYHYDPSLLVAVVLEDEPMIAWDIADVLTEAGFWVRVFSDAGKAAEAIANGGVSLAVLDIVLGQGRASTAASDAARRAKVPILFCSGSGSPPFVEGATFVQKPYSREGLLAGVAQATARIYVG